MRAALSSILLLLPFAFLLLPSLVIRRDAEVVHPLVQLRSPHALALAALLRLFLRRRRVEPPSELARPYDLHAAAPDVIRQRSIRSHNLHRPTLARRLDQLLDALVRVRPARRVEDAHAHEARPVRKELIRRSVKHSLHRHARPAREPRQLPQQTPPRARLVPVPPHALPHHVVAVNQVRHKTETIPGAQLSPR